MVEYWAASRLDVKCLSKVINAYDRPVFFQVWSVSVDGLSGDGILVLN